MAHLEMIFSIIAVVILLGVIGFILWKKWQKSREIIVSFLETSEITRESYRPSERTTKRYFHHKDGVVDLLQHPEFVYFRDVNGSKEYLVEPWNHQYDLTLQEGKSMIVIFSMAEIEEDGVKVVYAIPCLRRFESLIDPIPDNNPFNYEDVDGKSPSLGVSYDNGKRYAIHNSDNFLGVVKYESV